MLPVVVVVMLVVQNSLAPAGLTAKMITLATKSCSSGDQYILAAEYARAQYFLCFGCEMGEGEGGPTIM